METRPATTLRSRRVCRFCLTENDPLTFIHDVEVGRNFQVPLPIQIMSCVAIEVYSADGMPQMICNNCRWNLDRSYKFKMQCRKADEALRNYPSSGVLPRPFPPISTDPDTMETSIKRVNFIDSPRNLPANKKPRLDNGSGGIRKLTPVVRKQENISYKDHNDSIPTDSRDESELEPGEIQVHACDQCDRAFPSAQSLRAHVQRVHSESPETKPHICSVCGKQFRNSSLLQRHEKVHRDLQQHQEVRYACGTCGREFLAVEELEHHEEIAHQQVKPHRCNICSKRFSYQAALERHELQHVNEDKSFVCEHCKEAFRTSTKLARHLLSHTAHRPFACELCPKTFMLSHQLSKHVKNHRFDDERIHQCGECDKAFRRKDSLDVHRLTHVKRGLVCGVCQENCRNRADYVTHIKQHIEEDEPDDEEEDFEDREDEGLSTQNQVLYIKGKDGDVVKKTVKTLMPVKVIKKIEQPVPQPKKRTIVRRIIRQGNTTREVIMNQDGTPLDPAELARLPQGKVVKRVVVKKPLDKATKKLINSNTVPSPSQPKVLAVQRVEPKIVTTNITSPNVVAALKENRQEKLKQLEQLERQQRIKLEELQQQNFDENDDMLPESRDDGSDEEEPQLPLKRVFVKRKQSVFDEEKEYPSVNETKPVKSVEQMSQELCNILNENETPAVNDAVEQKDEQESVDSKPELKMVITQNSEDSIVKLQFEDSTQENCGTMQVELEQSTEMDGRVEGDLEESVVELTAVNETIGLNETTDSRDSLEAKLSQMEG